MNRFILSIIFLLSTILAYGQGAGFGFQRGYGAKSNFNVGTGYDQSMETDQYSIFARWHSDGGKRGNQIFTGFRRDKINFTNNTNYFDEESGTIGSYNVDAYLDRLAWKLGYVTQWQFIGTPGKFVASLNGGVFYEFTSQMERKSDYDDIEYNLYSEQNRNNLIFTGGIEARFYLFTVGYKLEYMVFDMINHDYLKQQTVYKPGNNSELRGLQLSPIMSFVYIAFHLDFFNSNYDN